MTSGSKVAWGVGVASACAATPGKKFFKAAALLSYNGSAYQGWQVQPQRPTVQGALEDALQIILRENTPVVGSGRTDSGVHALNQVASFLVPEGTALPRLQASLNGLCGPGIAIKALVRAPAAFHARYDALGKLYRYDIHNRPYPPVFNLHRCWWLHQPLDLAAMREAASHLPGEHDFSAFRSSQCGAQSPVRALRRVEILAEKNEEFPLSIELEASGFLQHMARIITGTLVAVGRGKVTPDSLPAILSSRSREQAGQTAPGRGLHLISVQYDPSRFPQVAAWTKSSAFPAGDTDAPNPES